MLFDLLNHQLQEIAGVSIQEVIALLFRQRFRGRANDGAFFRAEIIKKGTSGNPGGFANFFNCYFVKARFINQPCRGVFDAMLGCQSLLLP